MYEMFLVTTTPGAKIALPLGVCLQKVSLDTMVSTCSSCLGLMAGKFLSPLKSLASSTMWLGFPLSCLGFLEPFLEQILSSLWLHWFLGYWVKLFHVWWPWIGQPALSSIIAGSKSLFFCLCSSCFCFSADLFLPLANSLLFDLSLPWVLLFLLPPVLQVLFLGILLVSLGHMIFLILKIFLQVLQNNVFWLGSIRTLSN